MPSACTGLIGDRDSEGGSTEGSWAEPGSGVAAAAPTAPGRPGPTLSGVDRTQACGPTGAEPAPLRRLSHVEYYRTVTDLLEGIELELPHLPPDVAVHGFENNVTALSPSPMLLEQYGAAAEQVAEAAMEARDELLPCLPEAGDPAACGRQFVESFGARAFRRPLMDEEVDRYVRFFEESRVQISFDAAMELVMQAMLQSPQFLYRLETSAGTADTEGRVRLDDFEMASRLSYFIWQSMPDDELFQLAADGKLSTREQIEQAARRMVEDPRAAEAILDFHRQWLEFDRVMIQMKDPYLYPSYNETLRNSMREESDRFIEHVFTEGSGTLREVLASTETFVNGPLADLYGVEAPADGGWHRVALDPGERAGILTQATFLASHAHSTNGSPPLRGVAVLEQILCAPPPPPPPNANTATPEATDSDVPTTNRQRFEERTAPEVCQGCHVRIDGIGFGFEAYDSIGAFRTEDNGLPVDSSGQLVDTDVDGPFQDAVEMVHRFAESEQVAYCATTNWFRYAFGRDERPDEWCKLDEIHTAMEESGGDVRELMVRIATSDEFLYRTPADF